MITTYYEFILEKLHINNLVDNYSDSIYDKIINSNSNKILFEDIPKGLNIKKIIISIKNFNDGTNGLLNLDKSYKTKAGWIIYLYFKKNFPISTLKHELNHAYRLTLIGKENMIKNLNHIRTQNVFLKTKDSKMEYLFHLIYLANDEEINAKVIETHGFIKDIMRKNGLEKLNNQQFDYLIKETEGWKIAQLLMNFKCADVLDNLSENNINKLFSILEDNKIELDRLDKGPFRKLRTFIKSFKDTISNKTNLNFEDTKIYKPKKGVNFYDKWITDQGKKLKKRLSSLHNHYL